LALGNQSEHLVITSNIIHRVFQIAAAGSVGTAFEVLVDGRNYLVTALHVVANLPDVGQVGIRTREGFTRVPVRVLGRSSPESDIAVLAADRRFCPPHLAGVEASADGLTYGQDVYFLGFPYDFMGSVALTDAGYPLPFVKRALVSQLDMRSMMLDGHNNPGFSGGPVVFRDLTTNALKIGGLISGYRFAPEPVFEGTEATKYNYRHNTGIIVAPSIDPAIEIIKANPSGFQG
jgi:S1-C subfamily serine protease